jgi:hypothetical protein
VSLRLQSFKIKGFVHAHSGGADMTTGQPAEHVDTLRELAKDGPAVALLAVAAALDRARAALDTTPPGGER